MHDALNEYSGTCGDEGERVEESAAPPRVSTHSHAAMLLAAAAKLSARLPVFSTEDLAVAAHHLYPSAFALQGFPEHPDHVKIRVRVCGTAGLVGQGYFAREKGGLRLTAEGHGAAQALPVADAPEAAPAPRRKRIVRRLRRVRLKRLRTFARHATGSGGTSLAMQKRITIERTLVETGYNLRRTAKELDISRSSIYRLVKSYGIDVDRERRKARGIVVESAPPVPPPATVPAPAQPIDRGPLTDREARVVYAISRTDAAQRYLRGETERLTQEDADGFWGVAEGYDTTTLTALLERARTHYDRRLPAVGVVRKLSDLHTQLVVCRFRWSPRRP